MLPHRHARWNLAVACFTRDAPRITNIRTRATELVGYPNIPLHQTLPFKLLPHLPHRVQGRPYGIAVGVGVAAALGAALNNIAIGIALGAAVGHFPSAG